MQKIGKYIFGLALLAAIAYGAQVYLQDHFDIVDDWSRVSISLGEIYLVQVVLSLVLLIALVMVKKSAAQQLGYVFLGVFTIKVVVSYFFAQNVLSLPDVDFFKYNYLAVFFLFMIFDLYVAYSMLNKSENTTLKNF